MFFSKVSLWVLNFNAKHQVDSKWFKIPLLSYALNLSRVFVYIQWILNLIDNRMCVCGREKEKKSEWLKKYCKRIPIICNTMCFVLWTCQIQIQHRYSIQKQHYISLSTIPLYYFWHTHVYSLNEYTLCADGNLDLRKCSFTTCLLLNVQLWIVQVLFVCVCVYGRAHNMISQLFSRNGKYERNHIIKSIRYSVYSRWLKIITDIAQQSSFPIHNTHSHTHKDHNKDKNRERFLSHVMHIMM